MIEVMPQSNGAVVGVRATDTLTHTDYYDVWIPALERAMLEYGKVRALLYMDADFHGWEATAAWDDTKFALSHRQEFERCALVGGPDWVRLSAKLFGLLMKGDLRCFTANQLDEAWAWLKAE